MPIFLPFAAAALIATGAHAAVPEAATAVAAAPAEEARREVPDVVLIGMAVTGFAIVGVAARRRQTGRRVTS